MNNVNRMNESSSVGGRDEAHDMNEADMCDFVKLITIDTLNIHAHLFQIYVWEFRF